MKYALLLYGNASQAPHYTPEEAAVARQAWFDLLAEMKAAQVYLFNRGEQGIPGLSFWGGSATRTA